MEDLKKILDNLPSKLQNYNANQMELMINNIRSILNDSNGYSTQLSSLEKAKNILKDQKYTIAIVANMSAGKSTFLNSLLEDDILPTSNAATTDCATEIYNCNLDEIRADIFFSDNKPSTTIDKEQLFELKEYAKKDEDCEDDKYKNVEKIKLYHPFAYIENESKEYEIIFIDTPGPNSTGKEYKEKHQNQTREVLRNCNLALFLFDYGQLDANLESDEHGLWNAIKTRKEKDPEFDVYFVVNKIDMGFSDNFKDCPSDISEEDEFKYYNDNWYKNEQAALEKIKKAAISHGIIDPIVYGVSSLNSLIRRKINKSQANRILKQNFDKFKDDFSFVFNEKAEEKLIEYIGIQKLEEEINNFINTGVAAKIKNSVISNIYKVSSDYANNLVSRLIKLQADDKETISKQLEQAEYFLKHEAINKEKEFNKQIATLKHDFEIDMKKFVIGNIDRYFDSQISYLAKLSIIFMRVMTEEGLDYRTAKIYALDNVDQIKIGGVDEYVVNNKINIDKVSLQVNEFIRQEFNELKDRYLDTINIVKNQFTWFNEQNHTILNKFRIELEKELDSTLKIEHSKKFNAKQLETIDFEDLSYIQINSSVKQIHQDAEYITVSTSKWYKPWTWGNTTTIKVQDELDFIKIDTDEVYSEYQEIINEYTEILKNKEIDKYMSIIKDLTDSNADLFNTFKDDKIHQIKDLKANLDNIDNSIQELESNIENLKNILKGDE